jgi:hypothetical protein
MANVNNKPMALTFLTARLPFKSASMLMQIVAFGVISDAPGASQVFTRLRTTTQASREEPVAATQTFCF